MKVVVVGGGIVGLSTAYFLGQLGVKTVLIERNSVGSHASGFAYGGISALGGTCNPGVLSPIAQEGMKIHRELANKLSQDTGINTEFRYHPSLLLAFTETEMRAGKTHANWVNNQDGYCANWLDARETQGLEPRISKNVLGSVYVEGTADVEPYKFSLALAHASEQLGTSIQHGNVIGLRKKTGRITGVLLKNEEISCDALVLAMGPWANWASDWLNLQIPIRPLKGQIIRLQIPGIPLSYSVGWNGNYATSKPDGLVWAGTTEEEAGFNETITSTSRNIIMRSLIKMLPSLSESQLTQQTACLRPVSNDGLPILGTIPNVEGVYIATGGARTGITLGPAMGRITAQLITEGVSDIAIGSLQLDRFEN